MTELTNARLDEIVPGDRVIWEYKVKEHGVTRTVRREGIAHHRDVRGNWVTEEGGILAYSEKGGGITITIPGEKDQVDLVSARLAMFEFADALDKAGKTLTEAAARLPVAWKLATDD